GLNSVQQNYYDCLQENLESGRTIGICDEIHSIYLCDFFWSQAEPLSKVIVPKILGFLTGQGSENSGSSGGGEYLGVRNAWENAQDSAEFFGNYFSQNSFEAFGARATSSAGSSICK